MAKNKSRRLIPPKVAIVGILWGLRGLHFGVVLLFEGHAVCRTTRAERRVVTKCSRGMAARENDFY